jgi:hypothetical protein
MAALALLVIALSAYVSFARTREGADPARSVGEGMAYAASFGVLLGSVSLWLSGAAVPEVAEDVLGVLGLSFLASLLSSFAAGFAPRRSPVAHW